jgi:hypothetical protein
MGVNKNSLLLIAEIDKEPEHDLFVSRKAGVFRSHDQRML